MDISPVACDSSDNDVQGEQVVPVKTIDNNGVTVTVTPFSYNFRCNKRCLKSAENKPICSVLKCVYPRR